MSVYRYEDLTAEEIKELGENKKAIAILSIGSIEQHGPHLPVGTDCFCGTAYIEKALEKITADADFLMMPAMPYSCSVEHIHFPGTIALKPMFVIEFITEIGKNLMRTGIENMIITTGHGGNEHVMEVAARELRVDGMHTFCIHNFLAEQKLGAPDEEIHAGAVETSVILAISDKLVKQDKIDASFTASKEKWFGMVNMTTCASQAWLAEDVGINGVCGAPENATLEAGIEHIELMSNEIAKACDTIAETLFC